MKFNHIRHVIAVAEFGSIRSADLPAFFGPLIT
jgi:hypothetical protein